MAESFSREKSRQAPQKGGWKIQYYLLPVTPAGTSIEVQNEWEENTHTHKIKQAENRTRLEKKCVGRK